MSKHFKFRSIMSIIYALIMLLPLTSVAFRCFYTIFNKNAYQSYSGNTEIVTNVDVQYKYVSNEVSSVDDLVVGNIYQIDFSSIDFEQVENNSTFFFATFVRAKSTSINNVNYYNFTFDNDLQSYIRCYYQASVLKISFEYTAGTIPIDTSVVIFQYLRGFNEDYINYVSYTDYNEVVSVTEETTQVSNLDNAFEYSLHEFIGNNGRGVLNLTDWFTSVFLQNSTHTQLYLDFINWYMNYTLLVSCVYILYLVLMWFVSLARRLLTNMIEKGGELK